MPAVSAPSPINGFIVEPGGYNPCVARLSKGLFSSVRSESQFASISLGLKLGLLTIAKISPVLRFKMITAPLRSPRAS